MSTVFPLWSGGVVRIEDGGGHQIVSEALSMIALVTTNLTAQPHQRNLATDAFSPGELNTAMRSKE